MINSGDIYYAKLDYDFKGSEQRGVKPVLVISVNRTTFLASVITSRMSKARIPTHVYIQKDVGGVTKDSIIMLEQLYTLPITSLRTKIGTAPDTIMDKVVKALSISIDLDRR